MGGIPPNKASTPAQGGSPKNREKKWVKRAQRQKARRQRETKNGFKNCKNRKTPNKTPKKCDRGGRPSVKLNQPKLQLVPYSETSDEDKPNDDMGEIAIGNPAEDYPF